MGEARRGDGSGRMVAWLVACAVLVAGWGCGGGGAASPDADAVADVAGPADADAAADPGGADGDAATADTAEDARADASDPGPDLADTTPATVTLCNWGEDGDFLLDKLDPTGALSADCRLCLDLPTAPLAATPDTEPLFERVPLFDVLGPGGSGLPATVFNPSAARAFDVSGDGDRDLIVDGRTPGGIETQFAMLADGQGGFAAPVLLPWLADGGRCYAFADLDHSGAVDAVCATPTSIRAYWSRPGVGLTATDWAPVAEYAAATPFPYTITVADLEDDGDLDLFVAYQQGPNRAFRNDGGAFAEVTTDIGLGEVAHVSMYLDPKNADPDRPGLSLITVDKDGTNACQIAYAVADAKLTPTQPLAPPQCDLLTAASIQRGWLGRPADDATLGALWELFSAFFGTVPEGYDLGYFHSQGPDGACVGDFTTPTARARIHIADRVCEVKSQAGTPVGNTVACWADGAWRMAQQLEVASGLSTGPQPQVSWGVATVVNGALTEPLVTTRGHYVGKAGEDGGTAVTLGPVVGVAYGKTYGQSTTSVRQLGQDGRWVELADWVDEAGQLRLGTAGITGLGQFATVNTAWLKLAGDARAEPYVFIGAFEQQVVAYRVKRRGNILRLWLVGTASTREGYGAVVRVATADGTFATSRTAGFERVEWPTGNSYGGEVAVGLGEHTAARVEVAWPSGIVTDYGELAAGDGPLGLLEGEVPVVVVGEP